MEAYRIERLGNHDRSSFASGSEALDTYFLQTVGQDIRRGIATCFVAVDSAGDITGFYTLSASSVPLVDLDERLRKKLPRYSAVPTGLIGRLAVAVGHRGQGLGGAMVADALERARRSELAAHLMVVDAKDDAAVNFYLRLEFSRLSNATMRLVRVL